MIKPTPKEIARADGDHTTVVRPASQGGYNIAVVHLDGALFFMREPRHVDTKAEIGPAIKSELRMLDKCAAGGNMADRARHR